MHMDIGYTVVQSIRRGYWIWTVQTEPPKTGEAPGKDLADKKARRAIEDWLLRTL